MKIHPVVMALAIVVFEAHADSSTLDSATGGGVGDAAIGHQVSGRNAAIADGETGAAVVTAVNAGEQHHYSGAYGHTDYQDVGYYDRREYDRLPAY